MKNKYLDVTFVACQTEQIINEETQEHLFKCKVILSKLDQKTQIAETFEEIFTNKNDTEALRKTLKKFMIHLNIREQIIDEESEKKKKIKN